MEQGEDLWKKEDAFTEEDVVDRDADLVDLIESMKDNEAAKAEGIWTDGSQGEGEEEEKSNVYLLNVDEGGHPPSLQDIAALLPFDVSPEDLLQCVEVRDVSFLLAAREQKNRSGKNDAL